MGAYTSSIASQLGAFERETARLTRLTLLEGGRRFRGRLLAEQMSKPPAGPGERRVKARPGDGIRKKTGRARRSAGYRVITEGSLITLRAAAGGHGAYYVEDFERRGLIDFKGLFAEEATITSSNLAHRMAFLARNPAVQVSVGQVGPESAGGEVEGAAQEIAGHIRGVRAARKIHRIAARLGKIRSSLGGGLA